VVIGTGYNEGSNGFAQNFDLIVSAARAKGAVRIVWMNYRLRDGLTRGGTDNNGSYISNNAALQQLVASGAYPDVFIANWRDYTAPVRSWFVPDGIHYQPVGALGAADYISRWITHLFLEPCPKPMTVGGRSTIPAHAPDGQSPPDVRPLRLIGRARASASPGQAGLDGLANDGRRPRRSIRLVGRGRHARSKFFEIRNDLLSQQAERTDRCVVTAHRSTERVDDRLHQLHRLLIPHHHMHRIAL
jgi:hypothetical protein